jgi:hypothetical protein
MDRIDVPSSRIVEAQGLALETQVDLWFTRRGVVRHKKVSPEVTASVVEDMANQGYKLLAGERRTIVFD